MKTNKGVSLIVLVITIIVMIIIVGAVIISLTDTNVIDQAESAATKYRVAQLEENVKIEMQNALLAKYGTTENVSISIKEILNIEDDKDERIVNIATANSIPANMPAGTYYELDGNRYATKTRENEREINLASRAIDRENELVTNTYVVNDNLDVYYIISGTIGKEQPEIDDEKVINLTMQLMATESPTDPEVETLSIELKKELGITDIESNFILDYMVTMFDENDEMPCIYFYTIDRLYIMNTDGQLEYADPAIKITTCEYVKKVGQVLTELKTFFVGKNLSQINFETVNTDILKQCKSIKSILVSENSDSGVRIDGVHFEVNGIEYDFSNANTLDLIPDENGEFVAIYLTAGA